MKVYEVRLLNTNRKRGGGFTLTSGIYYGANEHCVIAQAREDWHRAWDDQPTLDIRAFYQCEAHEYGRTA